MTVISLEHTKTSIRGFLTRFMLELRPGVFVGELTKTTRDMLVKDIINEDHYVDMVVAYRFKGRIKIESYGCPTRRVQEMEGLDLIVRTVEKEKPLYKRVLGKPKKTLISHSIETGWICEYLLTKTWFSSYVDRIARNRSISRDSVIRIMSYICAMHDSGKLHPLFQAKFFGYEINSLEQEIRDLSGNLELERLSKGFRHECASKEIMINEINILTKEEENVHRSLKNMYTESILMHHQGRSKGCSSGIDESVKFRNLANADRFEKELIKPFCDEVISYFPVKGGELVAFSKGSSIWIFDVVLGLIMLSDWMASGKAFEDMNQDYYPDDRTYHDEVNARLDRICNDYDLSVKKFSDSYSYKELFNIDIPRPMQQTVSKAISDHPGFYCLLIEAPMGDGKTEAAMFAAMNAMATHDCQSIYFALPTGVTAEAILPRMSEMLERIKEDKHPNLITGTSWLSEGNDEDRQYKEMLFRRFRLIDRYSVGTVDQIMSSVMLTYYSEIKLASIGTKVVIIDEVHSYDAYMIGILGRFLKYMKVLGVPVVMLSATLSNKARDNILSNYGIHNAAFSENYPKICAVDVNGVSEYKCGSYGSAKRIKVEVVENEVGEFYQMAVDKVKCGGCEAFIVNSVSEANKAYDEISKLICDDAGICMFLFHARMTIDMKEEKTKQLINLFGKDRVNRPEKAIVITTPIIEMSIDLDFDFMFRQIAPVDAILQAVGRVARHDNEGTIRAKGVEPELVIMKTDKGNAIYGIGSKNPILEVSAEVLKVCQYISIPEDVPYLVNKLYDSPLISDYYSNEEIKRLLGVSMVSKFEPDTVTNMFEVMQDNKRKQLHTSTRISEIEYIKVAILDEEQLKIARNGDISYIRDLYRKTVVSIPRISSNVSREFSEKSKALQQDISPWFSDVFVDLGGEYYSLDPVYGLIIREDSNGNED